MNIERVSMDGAYDCAAACIAMALGLKRASDVYPLLGYDPSGTFLKGTSDAEVAGVLNVMGRRAVVFSSKELAAKCWGLQVDETGPRNMLLTTHELQIKLGSMQKGCAIVAVPSMYSIVYTHYVFCRKGEMFDPALGEHRYVGTAKSLPVLAAIFIGDESVEPL